MVNRFSGADYMIILVLGYKAPVYSKLLLVFGNNVKENPDCKEGMDTVKETTGDRHCIFFISTVYSKRNAHLIPNFFVAPLGEGGQKFIISIVSYGDLGKLQFWF